MAPAEVTKLVSDAGLRGRGGAGYATGRKWSFVPMGDDAPAVKYVVCNGDEMEPGSFKDRFLIEGSPHLLIEGMALACYAIQARHRLHLRARPVRQAVRPAEPGASTRPAPGATWASTSWAATSASTSTST